MKNIILILIAINSTSLLTMQPIPPQGLTPQALIPLLILANAAEQHELAMATENHDNKKTRRPQQKKNQLSQKAKTRYNPTRNQIHQPNRKK